ncbi:hypothetical protein [Herbaspirillum huttiense]|uniref:hypothetical protein n=1 Tax=Herbaspirillum huttiense TaxID=863372 RepID=UPI0039AFC3A0
MNRVRIYRNSLECGEYSSVRNAAMAASDFLAKLPHGHQATFAIREIASGALVAAVTNRRIVATVIKQRWEDGAPLETPPQYVGEEQIDVTEEVLLVPPNDFAQIKDGSEMSDSLLHPIINWSGPTEVFLEQSICAFFGVEAVAEVTPSALAFMISSKMINRRQISNVQLSLKFEMAAAADYSDRTLETLLDIQVASRVPGIRIRAVEVDWPPAF